MAEYTIELRDVVSRYNIFAFTYPFYDEKKRKEFEEKFIRHFYFREIGVPTVDRFIFNLENKMNTIFPYYNELFKTAEIEYSVLDNYNVTESFKRQSERIQKGAGVSSTVGQVMNENSGESDGDTVTEGNNAQTETTNNTSNETGENESVTTRSGSAEGKDTKNTSGSSTKNESADSNETVDKKHLDTPQGMVSLTGSNYLSTLDQDVSAKNATREESTKSSGNETLDIERSSSDKEETNGSHKTDTISNGERKLNGTDYQIQTTKATTKATGEQHSTEDHNTRTESKGEHSESYELIRKGNIGVDTDADMIQKHIKLQKVLRNIEKLFFDECEDLFMLVY